MAPKNRVGVGPYPRRTATHRLTLNVFAVHEDQPFDGATMDAVHAEIEQFASRLGLGGVDCARDA